MADLAIMSERTYFVIVGFSTLYCQFIELVDGFRWLTSIFFINNYPKL